MSEEQKDKAIELGQIIFTNTINSLEQQLAAAQARIAELREIHHGQGGEAVSAFEKAWSTTFCLPGEYDYMDPYDQRRWKGVAQQAWNAALKHAARVCEQHGKTLGSILAAEIRKEIEK